MACECVLASKVHYTATFRSLYGDVPIWVRRLLSCPCQDKAEGRSFAGSDLEAATVVAPELPYVTARYGALVQFGKVADLLSELLPFNGARNAGTVRNRTMRVGEADVRPHAATTAEPAAPVVAGLNGGYVRSRHRREERHFELIAGKVIDAAGNQSRFVFARNSPAIASDAFKKALAAAGVTAETPATVLCEAMPGCGGCNARRCRTPRSCSTGGTPRYALSTRCRRPAAWARPPRTWPTRRTGVCEVAPVAWALARMPTQTRGAVPLGAPYIRTRHGWHRAPGAPRRRTAGLP